MDQMLPLKQTYTTNYTRYGLAIDIEENEKPTTKSKKKNEKKNMKHINEIEEKRRNNKIEKKSMSGKLLLKFS